MLAIIGLQGGLLIAAAVIATIYLGKTGYDFKAKLDEVKDKAEQIKSDVLGGNPAEDLIAALRESRIFIRYQQLKAEARNIIAFAKTKHDSEEVPLLVDPADREAAINHYKELLAIIARAPIVESTPPTPPMKTWQT